MNLDGVAGIQYRIGKSQLETKLNRITQQQKDDMRMHNNSKQRFVTKYGKLSNVDQNTDNQDVEMYQTHNPGFCYRRNGQCRIPQVKLTSPSLNFANIHSLLFTDGQVDIEKVLCLHLLSAHKTETLKPPTKFHRTLSFLAKEQSPLERLIDRSRKKLEDSSLSQLLPTYVIDLNRKGSKEKPKSVIRDGRLAARVIINDKISQLVHTVLSALQHTNPEKMEKLLKISKEPKQITKIIDKPHIQEFIDLLKGHLLIYSFCDHDSFISCDSFHLTQPFTTNTIDLHVNSKTKDLTNLVSQIRENVLQLPADSTWRDMYDKSQASTNYADFEAEISVQSSQEKEKKEHEDRSSKNFRRNMKRNVTSGPKSAPIGRSRAKSREKDKNLRLPKFMEFMNEGPRRASLVELEVGSKRQDAEESNGSVSKRSRISQKTLPGSCNLFQKVDLATVATVLSDKAAAAHKLDLEELETSEESSWTTTSPTSSKMVQPEKASIRRTRCLACFIKWQTPLPKPRIPSIPKKIKIPNLDQSNFTALKSANTHSLSIMIDREMKKLSSESEKPVKGLNRVVTPVRLNYKKKNSLSGNYVDGVELDVMDLAKINQEIREKETGKKLDDFLNSKV